MKNFIFNVDMKGLDPTTLCDQVVENWGTYNAYHIFNLEKCDYKTVFENLVSSLGRIRLCHPINNKETKFSNSRDIRYTPNVPHYFASNNRQPLHNDYAYYQSSEAPEWLMLYCLEPSEFGGKTNLLSVETMKTILQKYNPNLLEKLKINVVWKYNGKDGDKIHEKPIFDGQRINWNYWQIKEDLNSDEVMSIREDFFDFLEHIISEGNMYDFSKSWKTGDCIIFHDQAYLHGRDAFLGNRWLKDHAFFNIKTEELK